MINEKGKYEDPVRRKGETTQSFVAIIATSTAMFYIQLYNLSLLGAREIMICWIVMSKSDNEKYLLTSGSPALRTLIIIT